MFTNLLRTTLADLFSFLSFLPLIVAPWKYNGWHIWYHRYLPHKLLTAICLNHPSLVHKLSALTLCVCVLSFMLTTLWLGYSSLYLFSFLLHPFKQPSKFSSLSSNPSIPYHFGFRGFVVLASHVVLEGHVHPVRVSEGTEVFVSWWWRIVIALSSHRHRSQSILLSMASFG